MSLPIVDTRAEAACSSKLKPYSKPRLTFYGEVQDLTLGGGSTTNEGASPGNTKQCASNPGAPCTVPSDPAVKYRVQRIGDHHLGIGLYLFEYKPGFERFGTGVKFGVMADEVERVMPSAVVRHETGIRAVDYAALGIFPQIH